MFVYYINMEKEIFERIFLCRKSNIADVKIIKVAGGNCGSSCPFSQVVIPDKGVSLHEAMSENDQQG